MERDGGAEHGSSPDDARGPGRPRSRLRHARTVLFAFAAVAMLWYVGARVRAILSVDSCLDVGGRYDYLRRRCDTGRMGAAGEDVAIYAPPGTSVRIAVKRHPMQPALAEYQRSLIVAVPERALIRSQLHPNTGGYGRANLYQLGASSFRIRDAGGSYLIDVARGTVAREAERSTGGRFLGSFDEDAKQAWRFIPASERAEEPTEMSGGMNRGGMNPAAGTAKAR